MWGRFNRMQRKGIFHYAEILSKSHASSQPDVKQTRGIPRKSDARTARTGHALRDSAERRDNRLRDRAPFGADRVPCVKIRAIHTELATPLSETSKEVPDRGTALVFGMFPPVSSHAACQAASTLHLLKSAGYRLLTATGPGPSMARHQVNFASESRFRASSSFLGRGGGAEEAVVFLRPFDFARISKPRWYKRRLEEIRRIRFLARVIATSRHTTLVLDRVPWISRYQWTQWLAARAVALALRRPLTVERRDLKPADLVERLTGERLEPPDDHTAEETAYAEAFDAGQPRARIRLTVLRAEQALGYWSQRRTAEEATRLRADLTCLLDVVRRHDLRELPQFRLLEAAPEALFSISAVSNPSSAEKTANALDPRARRFGVPVTRYMTHLRAAFGLEDRLPLRSRADARRLLGWYLQEAAQSVPQGWTPVPDEARNFFVETARGALEISVPDRDDTVVPAIGRDAQPFALSRRLAAAYMAYPDAAQRWDLGDPVDRIGFAFTALVTLRDSDAAEEVAGPALTWLREPLGGDPGAVSRLEFLLALQARFPMETIETGAPPWAQPGLSIWARRAARRAFPGIFRLLPQPKRRSSHHRTALLVGLPRSETGVGSNVHMSRRALSRAGIAPRLVDAAADMAELPGPNRQLQRSLRKSLVIHHVNADRIPQTVLSPKVSATPNAVNIGFLLWEFSELPEAHRLALEMLDEIWTPSSFLRRVYAKTSNIPVRNMLKGLDIPRVPPGDRGALFGAGGGTTVFLTGFDIHSSVARKNPIAAIRAFQAAFPTGREDVRFIVKTTPVMGNHWGDPERQMDGIRQAVALDPRIQLIESYLPFRKLLEMIAAADCLVSPHRAEGFGLMPAYALGLGTTVIATDYSGTTDFCTEETAFPVPFQLTRATAGQALFPMRDADWAEIDLTALASTMRRFAEDPAEGRRRAIAGQDLIRSRYSIARQAVRYSRRLAEIGVI